jgi:hypothetical protein
MTRSAGVRSRPHLVALVRAGATYKKGVLVESPNEVAARSTDPIHDS